MNIRLFIKSNKNALIKLFPLLAFSFPVLLSYFMHPETFELLWKGRTFQLFFIWLIALELILYWDKLQPKEIKKMTSLRATVLAIVLILPTTYVFISNYYGLNTAIEYAATQSGFEWANLMPLSIEYLVFTILFCLVVVLSFGTKGLKDFSIPALFLGVIGVIYTIDNIYPYGRFTPFQLVVPTTAMLAGSVLDLMGYRTSLDVRRSGFYGEMPFLRVVDPSELTRNATYGISWPCAGVESFLIFSVTILLFLKMMPISWKTKIFYFGIGALITYLINIWRIVTIFTIGINYSEPWPIQVQMFHDFYGPLYSIAWIILYPLLIIGGHNFFFRNGRAGVKQILFRFKREREATN